MSTTSHTDLLAECETCGQRVPAEITHNGVMNVGHYVHCGWGHMCAVEDLKEPVRYCKCAFTLDDGTVVPGEPCPIHRTDELVSGEPK